MPAVLRSYEVRYSEKKRQLREALGLATGTPAEAIAEMNVRLGIPSSLLKLGYKPGDLSEMAQDSHRSFFNATAPHHPTVQEHQGLLEEVLG
jgi:alcohol dehydrogenase class IV